MLEFRESNVFSNYYSVFEKDITICVLYKLTNTSWVCDTLNHVLDTEQITQISIFMQTLK